MGLAALPMKPENSCGANRLWLHLTTATLVLSESLTLGSGAPGGLTIFPVTALVSWGEESGTMEYQSCWPFSVLLTAWWLAGSGRCLLALGSALPSERRFLVMTAMARLTLERWSLVVSKFAGGGA